YNDPSGYAGCPRRHRIHRLDTPRCLTGKDALLRSAFGKETRDHPSIHLKVTCRWIVAYCPVGHHDRIGNRLGAVRQPGSNTSNPIPLGVIFIRISVSLSERTFFIETIALLNTSFAVVDPLLNRSATAPILGQAR